MAWIPACSSRSPCPLLNAAICSSLILAETSKYRLPSQSGPPTICASLFRLNAALISFRREYPLIVRRSPPLSQSSFVDPGRDALTVATSKAGF